MNEKFYEKLDWDKIVLYSIYKPMKGLKRIHRIAISRDMISLNTEKQTKSMKQDNTCIEGGRIVLKISQTEDYYGIQKKMNISISIYNGKITCNISTMTHEHLKIFAKDVNEEIECTNKIRYIVLMKIMCFLFKVCKKKDDEVTKKNKNKNKNKKQR